jgi:deoxyribodipyrimidine photolyase-like uncharacterized protein
VLGFHPVQVPNVNGLRYFSKKPKQGLVSEESGLFRSCNYLPKLENYCCDVSHQVNEYILDLFCHLYVENIKLVR